MNLHMVSVPLVGQRLFARSRPLPPRQTDVGYLVHCQMAALFGDRAPKPFHFEQQGRHIRVLGYASSDAQALQERARLQASPEAYSACAWEGVASKPMPTQWRNGQQLAFEVRACPVIRKASSGDRYRKGAEVDVFLSECWKNPREPVDREQAYKAWLEQRLEGVASLGHVRLARFKRERLVRRTQGEARKSHITERPDATFSGVLQILDPDRFASLLARGVGRHRAFGFGMLLLKPA